MYIQENCNKKNHKNSLLLFLDKFYHAHTKKQVKVFQNEFDDYVFVFLQDSLIIKSLSTIFIWIGKNNSSGFAQKLGFTVF